MADYTIQSDTLNLLINKEICFTNHKNQFKEKIMKEQTKILTQFSSFLKSLLEPGEEILLSVRTASPIPFLRQWTTGLLFYYKIRCVLIFTNKRILHFPTKFNFAPKQSVSQIRYGDIEEVKFGGFPRLLKMIYKSGKKEIFSIIQSSEFNKLKTLEHLFNKGQSSQVEERHSLCPRCFTPLLKNIFSCPSCHLKFKNLKEAMRVTIFYPGGGYFYTKHPLLGVVDAIADGYFLIKVLLNVIIAFNVTGSWDKFILFPVLLFFEKWTTINHVKHYISEYIPVDDNISKASLNPIAEPFPPYQNSRKRSRMNWPKTVYAVLFLIFGMSLLAGELYLYLIAPRYRNSAQRAQGEMPLSPEHQRALAALIESRYTRVDDYEKWIPVLYQQKDFSAVENRVIDLLKDRSTEAEAYQLYTLYDTLGDVKDNRDIHLKQGILDEWCSKQPESHIPWLLRGIFYIGYAWQIRGGGWARDVPKDAWPKFEAMLDRAQADLEKSYQLNPNDPNSSCQLLLVARGLGLSRDEMEKYFQNAISASPFHYGSYDQKLCYLMPKWHGTQQEMNDFAMECLKASSEHPFLGLVTVTALEESHYRSPKSFLGRNKNYLGRDNVWPTVVKMYDNYFAKYPEDIRMRFSYACRACLAQKYEVAIKQFETIGDRWMETTSWKSLNDYHLWRAYAYAAYAMRLPPEQAIPALKKSIDLNPFQKSSYFKLGASATKLGRYDEAEAAYLNLLEVDPNSAEAHLLLSQIYEKKNDPIKVK